MTIIYAIGAALSWGTADFLAGQATRRHGVLAVLLLLEAGGLAAVGLWCIITQPAVLSGEHLLMASGAGLVGVVGLGLFYQAMAMGTVSVVAPISSAGVILPVAVGVVGGDAPSVLQWAGFVAIIAGVMLASREQREDPVERGRSRRSVMLALLSAVGFGLFFVLGDRPAEESVPWTVLMIRAAPLPFVLGLWWRSGAHRPPPRDTIAITLIGCVDLAATTLIALANSGGALSIVAVLGSMYPVITVLLAAVVLRERVLPSQYLGVALALGGVGLVAGGG